MNKCPLIIGIAFIISGFISIFLGIYIKLNEEPSGFLWILLLVMGVVLSFLGFIVVPSGKDETSN